MQLGYSLTFGETVAAADVDHGECAKFQIACPACREAVFKGFRAIPRPAHYFSHYRACAENEVCELRVGQMAKEAGVVDGFIGHGQTLESFLRSFRNDLSARYAEASGADASRAAMDICSRPYADTLLGSFDQFYTFIWERDDPRGAVAAILSSMPVFKNKSPFWCRRAASYVLDVLRHLKTAQCKPNRRFLMALVCVAWAKTHTLFCLAHEPLSNSEAATNVIKAIANGRSSGAVRHLNDLAGKSITSAYERGRKVESEAVADQLNVIKNEMAQIPEEQRPAWIRDEINKRKLEVEEIRGKRASLQEALENMERDVVDMQFAYELQFTIVGLLGLAVPCPS